MTYRELLAKEKDIQVEHYEAFDSTPMSAVYVGYYAIYYFEEDILFKGSTKEEASKWISDNIEDFRRIQVEVDAMTRIEQEEYGFL